jgi:hypothetical protein
MTLVLMDVIPPVVVRVPLFGTFACIDVSLGHHIMPAHRSTRARYG